MDDRDLLDALHSGLPIRIRAVTELWRDRFFDSEAGEAEWRATVLFDPMSGAYQFEAAGDPELDVSLPTLADVRAALRRTIPVRVRPAEPGRYYYITTIDVETLSLSDLEELRRWLQGEIGPVVEGERDMGSALERGMKRALVRALRLPARRLRIRTDPFEYRPEDPSEG